MEVWFQERLIVALSRLQITERRIASVTTSRTIVIEKSMFPMKSILHAAGEKDFNLFYNPKILREGRACADLDSPVCMLIRGSTNDCIGKV